MNKKSEQIVLEKLQQAEDQISDRIADNMDTFGVSSTVGRLLGIIYLNRAPMTLDELAEKTGMSKTRMSQVMRQMMALNIADKTFVKGSRKEYYSVENNYVQTFISLFTTNWNEVVSKNSQLARRLQENIAQIEQSQNERPSKKIVEKTQELKQELDEWIIYYDWIRRLVDFFESGEILNHVPVYPNDEKSGPKE
ncbi:DNA-binding transcriptional regulator GbsR (MarR family) [Virgibacillus halotolerans]|uniref:GbsR/MarR family transcriptional regulator n=1 Tax=Virgibacillus halotolerans TaxID=1071053 RepID=UPI0019609207|nr:GbsR/MarR family transcriptional regulator [Virgibacillus halotolerans]MBM7599648.1 DNA-binding transcriptional regulator GbsR (MarR family) [Virgibacillus halotolerans]